MSNILKIFTTDVKKLSTNLFAFIIAIGICFLPSLYAWFNIYSNWDPYANTANIKVAVVSDDQGSQLDDGTIVNMGNEVINSLKENNKIGWVFTNTSEEALDGVNSGKYYAAVVINPKFTNSMYNVFQQDFKNPTISYYENEKKNAVATKITDTAISTLKESINEKFIEVVTSTIFEKTNNLANEVENKDELQGLVDKLTNINSSIQAYNATIDTLIASNQKLTSSIYSADNQIPNLRNRMGNASTSIRKADQSLDTTKTKLSDFSTNVQDTLNAIETSIDTISTDIRNADIADKAQHTADSIQQTIKDTDSLVTSLNTLYNSLNELLKDPNQSEQIKSEIQKVIDTIKSMSSKADDIQNVLDTANQSISGINTDSTGNSIAVKDFVNTKIDMVQKALSTSSQSIDNIKNMYVNNLVPEMDNVLDNMSQVLVNVTNLMDDLQKTMGHTSSVFNSVNTTVSGINTSLQQIKSVLTSVSNKLTEAIKKVNSAGEDEKLQTLLQVFQGDPETYGNFFANPVAINTKEVYPITNYGSAVAPFYTVLALWVGAIILVAIIKVKAEPKNMSNIRTSQLFWGRYLLFFAMGQLQAAIIVIGNIFLLHCQVQYPFMFWFAASITSFTFTLLIYSLTLSFGDIGKALAVVIMVIQIAGSGGTYPIEILPSFYQNVYLFFPFPYAINAMRETVAGVFGSTYEKSIAVLIIFAIVSIIIGLIIRIPFVELNHFVEKRMKDTKMM